MAPPRTTVAGTGHAVVVGGSMAGLLAARALTGSFDRVTVVERDRLPDGAQPRKGVPQGRQIHALLARGLEGLETLFPGFGRELEAAGAVPMRLPGDVLILGRAGWVDRRAPGWVALSATRPLIEATVLRRLRTLSGVTVLDGYEATGRIRAAETGERHVPIVAMTAHAMKGDEARCLAAGMDGYLSKPIDPDELFDVIERHLAVSTLLVSLPTLSPPKVAVPTV